MKRIHDSLDLAFSQNRVVFWYDSIGEWKESFESFQGDGVTKLLLENNLFGLKVQIHQDPDPEARFLIYAQMARPNDNENWLLDLLLQGKEFKADRASLALQEVGLPYDYHSMADEHVEFFRGAARVQKLKDLLAANDDEPLVRLKMMAVLTGASCDLEDILLVLLKRAVEEQLIDPATDLFSRYKLFDPFWLLVCRYLEYTSLTPSIRDLAIHLFRGANPLDGAVSLSRQAQVFLQRWKHSTHHCESFRQWSSQLQSELHIDQQVNTSGSLEKIGGADVFEIFEKYFIHKLCDAFQGSIAGEEVDQWIETRRQSFWFGKHEDGYQAISHTVEFKRLTASSELTMDSLDEGIRRYTTTWWQIDKAYRRICYHLRRYNQPQVMNDLSSWVEKSYVTNYLLPLSDHWGDKVRLLSNWSNGVIPSQRSFYDRYVTPFIAKGQGIVVIISDALRYEAAADFAERLNSENRFKAEIKPMFGSLPSYTQLGMAALLPGKNVDIDPASGNTMVDGRSATGTDNRSEILSQALQGRGKAILAEDFLALKSKEEGRPLMQQNDVLYVYHNVIDKTGDSPTTEAKTSDAVEDAFRELFEIVKKVPNLNVSNMLLVSDHGFLFQQDAVADEDQCAYPVATEWLNRNRRFAIGHGIQKTTDTITFSAEQLNLSGSWSCAFPASLGRFPLQGSGKRYVHGGFSLQEVIIPVVHINKSRVDDTALVNVEILRIPTRITTGQIALALFQEDAVTSKILQRQLRIGLFSKDGTPLSDSKTILFDSTDNEVRNREKNIVLMLSKTADRFNNTTVEIRLLEVVAGTTQEVIYQTHDIRIQKSFDNDFDEL